MGYINFWDTEKLKIIYKILAETYYNKGYNPKLNKDYKSPCEYTKV